MKARYWPSGDSCAPEISGLPKNSSRSRIGGGPAAGACPNAGTAERSIAAHTRTCACLNRAMQEPPDVGPSRTAAKGGILYELPIPDGGRRGSGDELPQQPV